ncbi:MAG: T9SS type A sorting domain-containing protein [Tannerella sp.]|nr:T9SS type A sorting domain-containing protein [Tannerella sp.]
MKRLSFLFLLSAFSFPAVHSQVEWFPIGAEWYYECDGYRYFTLSRFFVEKDTVVNGKTCRLISGDKGKEIVYVEDGCVYYFFNHKFRKMYDFTVKEGDVVELEIKTTRGYSSTVLFDTTVVLPCSIEKVTSKIIDGVELKEISAVYFITAELEPDYFITDRVTLTYLEKLGSEFPGRFPREFIPHVDPYSTEVASFHKGLRCYHDTDIDYITSRWQNLSNGKPCDYEGNKLSNNTVNNTNNTVKLYPNPVKDRIVISGETGNAIEATIILYDAMGKIVFEKKGHIPCELNIGHLAPGIYFIRIFDGAICLISNKLIKK